MRYESLREAAEDWVASFNAVPQGMIDKLMRSDYDDWTEVTTPAYGDRVYVYSNSQYGEVTDVREDEDKVLYLIMLDDGNEVAVEAEDFEKEEYRDLPMWGTMWSFGDSADDYWLTDMDGIRIMSECGFRVYESIEFGYYFGIDGAGYSFYEEHWIPLYIKRGLHWHDESKLSDDEKSLIKKYGGELYD